MFVWLATNADFDNNVFENKINTCNLTLILNAKILVNCKKNTIDVIFNFSTVLID